MKSNFFTLFSLSVPHYTKKEALEEVKKWEKEKRLFFLNAHSMMQLRKNKELLFAFNQAECLLNDGLGIDIGAKILTGKTFSENLNGTDFLPGLLEELPGKSIFFLGSTKEEAEKLERLCQKKWPQIVYRGAFHGYFTSDEEALKCIQEAKPDILLVGMGVGKQELFIDTHWERLKKYGVHLAIGAGAWIDFMTQAVPRAPKLVRALRLEWLYRFWIEPKRLCMRYFIEGPQFLSLVIKEKWRG